MPSSRLCVFGCVTKGITIHNFPNPAKFPERFKTWVELAGEQLKNLSVEEIARKKVCDKHFIESHRNRNNRLSALAIPTLHLPRASADSEVMNTELESVNIELPPTSQHVSSGGSAEVMNTELENSVELSSTSQHDVLSGLHTDHNCYLEVEEGSAKHNVPDHNISSAISLSDAVTITHDHGYCPRSIGNSSTTKKVRRKLSMTKKTRGSKTKTILSYLKEAERKTRNLQREILRLRKRCKFFKSRLETANKLLNSKAFQRVTANKTLPAKIIIINIDNQLNAN